MLIAWDSCRYCYHTADLKSVTNPSWMMVRNSSLLRFARAIGFFYLCLDAKCVFCVAASSVLFFCCHFLPSRSDGCSRWVVYHSYPIPPVVCTFWLSLRCHGPCRSFFRGVDSHFPFLLLLLRSDFSSFYSGSLLSRESCLDRVDNWLQKRHSVIIRQVALLEHWKFVSFEVETFI